MMIYVGNISYSMTTDELKELFVPYGNVKKLRLLLTKPLVNPKVTVLSKWKAMKKA
jgi:RNA recognition motif-containing protein